jgi:hypothetical protein
MLPSLDGFSADFAAGAVEVSHIMTTATIRSHDELASGAGYPRHSAAGAYEV